jgi:type 1 glutamine amidotransferase
MRALVLCDDYWHPARTPRAGLQPCAEIGWTFDWVEDAHDWPAEQMAAYPLLVLTKSNNVSSIDQSPWMTTAIEEALQGYVHSGNGLVVIHSGLAGYEDRPILRGLIGGAFLRHPPQGAVTLEPCADHPLTIGSAPTTVHDEHYFVALDDPQAEVILTTHSAHGDQPGGWTRREGRGQVCVLTPGHNLEVWLTPSYQALIQTALAWCYPRTEE